MYSREAKRTLIFRARKRHLKFLEHIMRKELLDNLTLTEHSEVKKDVVNQRLTDLV